MSTVKTRLLNGPFDNEQYEVELVQSGEVVVGDNKGTPIMRAAGIIEIPDREDPELLHRYECRAGGAYYIHDGTKRRPAEVDAGSDKKEAEAGVDLGGNAHAAPPSRDGSARNAADPDSASAGANPSPGSGGELSADEAFGEAA